MFDERTNRRAPKEGALQRWPKATCHKVDGGYIILSNERYQRRCIGGGRSAWAAWMEAEVAERRAQ